LTRNAVVSGEGDDNGLLKARARLSRNPRQLNRKRFKPPETAARFGQLMLPRPRRAHCVFVKRRNLNNGLLKHNRNVEAVKG
jgi:hypothetical protein